MPESNEMPESDGRPIEEIEDEEVADLPERQAMSLLNPTSLLGGTHLPPGVSSLPPVTLPTPGDPYQPDAADTAKT
jgi:hypothetical protein